MELIKEMASALWAVWLEMWEILKQIIPIAFKFIIWVLLGVIVLPCVFVAGNIYPWWVEWGEKGF